MRLGPEKLRLALRRTANRTATAIRTFAAKELRPIVGLPSATIKAGLKVDKASGTEQSAAVIALGRPLNLAEYGSGATQLKAGVKAGPPKRRVLYPGAFITPRGKVVIRDSDRPQNPRRPGPLTRHSEGLRPLYGRGIAKTMEQLVSKPEVRRDFADRYQRTLEAEIAFRLRGGGRRGRR